VDARSIRRSRSQFSPVFPAGAWSEAGPATEAARRLGHSVAMLLKRYANCIDGQELAANDRIARALEDGGV
jgi:hypothetical protein